MSDRLRMVKPHWIKKLKLRICNGLDWIGHQYDISQCSWESMEAPFVLWLGPTNNITKIFHPEEAIYSSPRFFLWPYGLRLHAFLVGLSFFCLLYCFGHQYEALCSFIIIVFITPFLLFFIFRIPLLQDALILYKPKNDQIDEDHNTSSHILDSISHFRPLKSHVYSWCKSCGLALWNCLPWPSHRRSLAWRRGSSTEIFIAAAYLEFFQNTPQSRPIPSGLIRWIIYQCWPIWSSYATLIFFSFFSANKNDKLMIIYLGFLWFILSCLLVTSSIFTTKRWIKFHEHDLIKLLPWMEVISIISYSNYIPLKIESINVGISIIAGLFTSIFIAIIKTLDTR